MAIIFLFLNFSPQQLLFLLKNNKISSYVFCCICAHRADQALSTLAMRKFCEDKVSSSLQPSQNRYIPFDLLIFVLLHTVFFCIDNTDLSAGISITLEGCSQGPSKWTAVHSSSIRSSFLPSPTSRKMEVSDYFHDIIPWLHSCISPRWGHWGNMCLCEHILYVFIKQTSFTFTHISSLFLIFCSGGERDTGSLPIPPSYLTFSSLSWQVSSLSWRSISPCSLSTLLASSEWGSIGDIYII